jgi:hypothetical protein
LFGAAKSSGWESRRKRMFLRVSTVIAILGLLAGIFSHLIQALINQLNFYPIVLSYLDWALNILFPMVVYLSLVPFLIAFFLSLGQRERRPAGAHVL